tara:strand:- start:1540 stop:1746 length:207 start_codon:yes stop_codon:yes gene_type:complete
MEHRRYYAFALFHVLYVTLLFYLLVYAYAKYILYDQIRQIDIALKHNITYNRAYVPVVVERVAYAVPP